MMPAIQKKLMQFKKIQRVQIRFAHLGKNMIFTEVLSFIKSLGHTYS